MRTLILFGVAAWAFGASATDTYVQGYYKQDGTYVAPHHQSKADDKLYNNYSSQGQVNPYSGAQGTKRNEYSNPPAYEKSSPLNAPQQSNQSTYGQQQKKSSTSDPYKW
jgi:hypothetical protein